MQVSGAGYNTLRNTELKQQRNTTSLAEDVAEKKGVFILRAFLHDLHRLHTYSTNSF
jgi:hypothetical protein